MRRAFDESAPLWARIEDCIRLIDLTVTEAKRRGEVMVDAKADYYEAKEQECSDMQGEGQSATYISMTVKGRPNVNPKLRAYGLAQVEYDNARDAMQTYKLLLRVLEAQMEREYEQARRM